MDQFVKLITESIEYLIVGGLFLLVARGFLSDACRREVQGAIFSATSSFVPDSARRPVLVRSISQWRNAPKKATGEGAAIERSSTPLQHSWWLSLSGFLAIMLFSGYLLVSLGYGLLRPWHRLLIEHVVLHEVALQTDFSRHAKVLEYLDSTYSSNFVCSIKGTCLDGVSSTHLNRTELERYNSNIHEHAGLLRGNEISGFIRGPNGEALEWATVEGVPLDRLLDFPYLRFFSSYVYGFGEDTISRTRANWIDGMKWAAWIHCDKATAMNTGPFGSRESKLIRGTFVIAALSVVVTFVTLILRAAKMVLESSNPDRFRRPDIVRLRPSSLGVALALSCAASVASVWLYWTDDVRHHRLLWLTDMSTCQQDFARQSKDKGS